MYIAERDAAKREDAIFDEIHTLTVEVANSYADPEALPKALPRLEDALRRLQRERAETVLDLNETGAQCAAAREALRSRGLIQAGTSRPLHVDRLSCLRRN